MCPMANIKCLSSDIKCPWTGARDELDKHLKTCMFNPLRPLITELINENQQLKDRTEQLEKRLQFLELICPKPLECSNHSCVVSSWIDSSTPKFYFESKRNY
ncbi:unnamed protein product [Rotaria sordida]|uniref:TRAF-type domain-containing protein n=1 Tax=Rotaria sordida TaxID=392033 RepID=A0A815F404_9BILA|nr:unnamed protein product [Rotaria sordida]